eukprot:scaffold1182_cov229-Ochromonas_danica.AAC.4
MSGCALLGRRIRVDWAHAINIPGFYKSGQIINSIYVRFAATQQYDGLVKAEDLHRIFSVFGTVTEICIKSSQVDHFSGKQSGVAFIHYDSCEDGLHSAFEAVTAMNGSTTAGIHFTVEVSRNMLKQFNKYQQDKLLEQQQQKQLQQQQLQHCAAMQQQRSFSSSQLPHTASWPSSPVRVMPWQKYVKGNAPPQDSNCVSMAQPILPPRPASMSLVHRLGVPQAHAAQPYCVEQDMTARGMMSNNGHHPRVMAFRGPNLVGDSNSMNGRDNNNNNGNFYNIAAMKQQQQQQQQQQRNPVIESRDHAFEQQFWSSNDSFYYPHTSRSDSSIQSGSSLMSSPVIADRHLSCGSLDTMLSLETFSQHSSNGTIGSIAKSSSMPWCIAQQESDFEARLFPPAAPSRIAYKQREESRLHSFA